MFYKIIWSYFFRHFDTTVIFPKKVGQNFCVRCKCKRLFAENRQKFYKKTSERKFCYVESRNILFLLEVGYVTQNSMILSDGTKTGAKMLIHFWSTSSEFFWWVRVLLTSTAEILIFCSINHSIWQNAMISFYK